MTKSLLPRTKNRGSQLVSLDAPVDHAGALLPARVQTPRAASMQNDAQCACDKHLIATDTLRPSTDLLKTRTLDCRPPSVMHGKIWRMPYFITRSENVANRAHSWGCRKHAYQVC